MSWCAPSLFERPGTPYGDDQGRDWLDNDVRFARFALAAALLARGGVDPDWSADIVHANDWPSALIPAYLSWSGVRLPSILTIHNLAYQGLFDRDSLNGSALLRVLSRLKALNSTTSCRSLRRVLFTLLSSRQ